MKPLRVHWASSKPNFGDVLSPLICERISNRPIRWAPVERCDIIALGSLMQRVKEGFWRKQIHVWGTGFIAPFPRHRSKHHYHAVRGKLSAAIIDGIPETTVFGDPGLLADRLLPNASPSGKRFRCLIIPHYKDKEHPGLQVLIGSGKRHVEVIDVFKPALEILEMIADADFVFSSAMHGLIAADSLGIPNAWVKLSDELRGGDFKFRDYYSAFGLEASALEPSAGLLSRIDDLANAYHRPGIDGIKEQLIASFPSNI
jgi:hypothetical protein